MNIVWNLWHGCHKKSEGCQHCYVFRRDSDYENVTICCTIENQRRVDERLPLFRELPIRHKAIICEPLLESIDFRGSLGSWAEQITVGGESGPEARVCD